MGPFLQEKTFEATANSRAVAALLLELVDALRERGLITRGDIAGAFFRADVVLRQQMREDEKPGVINAPAFLGVMEGYWAKRMTFHPDLFALRARVRDWEAAGSKEPHPAHAHEIRRAYDEPDD